MPLLPASRSRRSALRAAALSAALLTACGGGGRESGASDGESEVRPAAAVVPPPTVRLALDRQGIRLIDASTGSTRPVPFGAPGAEAIDAVTATSGAQLRREPDQDCGAGALDVVTFAGGLSLLVQEGRFVGWSVAAPLEVSPAPGSSPRTTNGIGVGSTRAALESAYVTRVDSTTLGLEFTADGLQGVLESESPRAPIVAMWAGAACVAR